MKKYYMNLEQRYCRLGDMWTFRLFNKKWLENSYNVIGFTDNQFLKMPEGKRYIELEEFENMVFEKLYHNEIILSVLYLNPKTGGYKTKFKIGCFKIIKRTEEDKIIDSVTIFLKNKDDCLREI